MRLSAALETLADCVRAENGQMLVSYEAGAWLVLVNLGGGRHTLTVDPSLNEAAVRCLTNLTEATHA